LLSSSSQKLCRQALGPFQKNENLTESQSRLVLGNFGCIQIKKVSPALGDFLSISLNYHASQNPNHQRPETLRQSHLQGLLRRLNSGDVDEIEDIPHYFLVSSFSKAWGQLVMIPEKVQES
jgi:hypothetical protein